MSNRGQHKPKIFKKILLENSKADIYEEAIHEWEKKVTYYINKKKNKINYLCQKHLIQLDVIDFIENTNHNRCICTTHIIYNYVIYNKHTNKFLIVGSDCVHKLMPENKELNKQIENDKNKINKIIKINKQYQKANKLYKKCLDCGEIFKIKELKEHDWKHQCPECRLTNECLKCKKETNIISLNQKNKNFICHTCFCKISEENKRKDIQKLWFNYYKPIREKIIHVKKKKKNTLGIQKLWFNYYKPIREKIIHVNNMLKKDTLDKWFYNCYNCCEDWTENCIK